MQRREIIKRLGMLPIAGTVAHLSEPGDFGSVSEGPEIYNSIGVETIINCRGTFTIIGGSIERPEVIAAMEAASGYFIQYDELAAGIGKRLAELTGAEWGIVSAGCAAGLKHVTAACVTGGNPEKLLKIPDLTGMQKTEVIIPRHSRNAYDHAVRNIGVSIITVETAEEMKQAISPRTAMMYMITSPTSGTGQPLSLEVMAEIAKPHNIPILCDAAAENLTIPNVHLKRGATIVAYSGGKALCGPQCAGLVIGPKDILMSAWQASSPHHGPGRDNKVGKEEMLGMLAAVETWVKRDHAAEWNRWLDWLDVISKKVTQISGVTTKITQPADLSNHAPVLHVQWDPNRLNITGYEVAEEVGRKKPRLAVGHGDAEGLTSINITPNQMQPYQVAIVADRIHGVLSQKRPAKTTTLKAAQADLSGPWEFIMQYFSSTSKHTMFLKQDGNWIEGSHRSDFATQEVVGMMEGHLIKLHSAYRAPGDGITFMFSGQLENNTIKGDVYLGEYLTATFTANRMIYKREKKPVLIPGGPPLAT